MAQQAQILSLQEQLNLALARRYAASSEKIAPNQLRLFDEAEADVATSHSDDTTSESITVDTHARKKRGRKLLPDILPRVDVVHELDDAARVCPHDGQVLTEIGEVTSEQLDIIPAKIQVLRHIRKKYACVCGQCIRTAPYPPSPSLKVWPHPACSPISPFQNIRMRCRCIGRKPFYNALGSTSRAPHWPTG